MYCSSQLPQSLSKKFLYIPHIVNWYFGLVGGKWYEICYIHLDTVVQLNNVTQKLKAIWFCLCILQFGIAAVCVYDPYYDLRDSNTDWL